MKLVEDAKDWWRWWSMRFMGMAVAFPMIWAQLPADAKAMIPEAVEPYIPMALVLAAMISRPIQQGDK
jgi:hypothetical protein